MTNYLLCETILIGGDDYSDINDNHKGHGLSWETLSVVNKGSKLDWTTELNGLGVLEMRIFGIAQKNNSA